MIEDGYNYLGTIDDMVQDYPWRFPMTKRRLEHSLVNQLLAGRPILINDGYLLQHDVAVDALNDPASLLSAMIGAGYVRVLARGAGEYTLDEMPDRMAHIPKIAARRTRADWPSLRKRVKALDRSLDEKGYIVPWPNRDLGAVFRQLARRLRTNGATPWTLGMGTSVRHAAFASFLAEFLDRMDRDTAGARSHWEALARKYADDPRHVLVPRRFMSSMMNLANEIYHYSFGVMLAADADWPVSVETQASPAFRDLIVMPDVSVEELPNLPRLNVPDAVLAVNPHKLVQILDRDRTVGEARHRWLAAKAQFDAGTSPTDPSLRELAKDYSRSLAEFIGKEVRYSESEGFIKYAIGTAAKPVQDAALLVAGTGGAALMAHAGMHGALAVPAVAYAISRLKDRGLGMLTARYRVAMFEHHVLPPDLVQASARAVSRLNLRMAPSSLEIGKSLALDALKDVPAFR